MILVGRKSGATPQLTWRPNKPFFRQIRGGGGDRNFAYLFGEGGEAVAVDPVAPAEVLEVAKAAGVRIRYVVNTHGHFDHTSGNEEILAASRAQLVCGGPRAAAGERTRFPLGPGEFELIATPGHTRDSMCALWQGRLVTGDTLFVGKVGGTGYGRDARDEYESLHSVIAALPEETEVWPGHDYGVDPSSTVGWEKATNPFYLQPDFDSFVHLKKNWAEYKRAHGLK
jgi:glyoxylase-like metal-dependent hydrolase (beta-lactamase superfamily II)